MTSTTPDLALTPPDPSWQPIADAGPFTEMVGPVYVKRDGLGAEEPLRFGFRVEPRHCNPRKTCHGGMLATFLDIVLARTASSGLVAFRGAPTISMTIDYMAPAMCGDWVESRSSILHRATRTGFVQCVLQNDKGVLVRGSAIYRLLTKPLPGDEGRTPHTAEPLGADNNKG